jgi:hypothetical protein
MTRHGASTRRGCPPWPGHASLPWPGPRPGGGPPSPPGAVRAVSGLLRPSGAPGRETPGRPRAPGVASRAGALGAEREALLGPERHVGARRWRRRAQVQDERPPAAPGDQREGARRDPGRGGRRSRPPGRVRPRGRPDRRRHRPSGVPLARGRLRGLPFPPAKTRAPPGIDSLTDAGASSGYLGPQRVIGSGAPFSGFSRAIPYGRSVIITGPEPRTPGSVVDWTTP